MCIHLCMECEDDANDDVEKEYEVNRQWKIEEIILL